MTLLWSLVSQRRTASPSRLGDSNRFHVVNEGGLDAIDGYVLIPGANLDREVFIGPPEDLVGAVIRGLKRRLFKFPSDEDESCRTYAGRDVRSGAAVVAGGDWFETTDSLAKSS